jgi:nascent polypeptide-associated complex subunit alpha
MLGLGGLNPKKMQSMMSQMGIKQEQIDASEVIIKGKDKNIIIKDPSVAKVNFSGNEMFQITGDVYEEQTGVSEADIETIVNQTGKSKEEAKAALEKNNGDLAAAIMELK